MYFCGKMFRSSWNSSWKFQKVSVFLKRNCLISNNLFLSESWEEPCLLFGIQCPQCRCFLTGIIVLDYLCEENTIWDLCVPCLAHIAGGRWFIKGLYAIYWFLRNKYAICQAVAGVMHDCRVFRAVFDHCTVTVVAFTNSNEYSTQVGCPVVC